MSLITNSMKLITNALRRFWFLKTGICIFILAPTHAFQGSPGRETWSGIIETAGLWGSMELNMVRNGSDSKADCRFVLAGSQITTPVLMLSEQGSELTFSTKIQVMDVGFTLD
ncbi:MAG TPA: hypothetical protein VN843_07330, partial [Anaerolineales bacterium]|nr:hypothetical protein [Anaerolineales bacterium]